MSSAKLDILLLECEQIWPLEFMNEHTKSNKLSSSNSSTRLKGGQGCGIFSMGASISMCSG